MGFLYLALAALNGLVAQLCFNSDNPVLWVCGFVSVLIGFYSFVRAVGELVER